MPPPAKPVTPAAEVIETDGGLTITCRPKRGAAAPPGCFLGCWLTCWTVGCVVLLGVVIAAPHVFLFLFALPFWAAWAFAASMLANSLFGAERLTASADGVGYEYRVLRPVRRRVIPRGEILRVQCVLASDDEEAGKVFAVEVHTTGRRLVFGSGLGEAECAWLAWKITAVTGLSAATRAAPGGRPSDCAWALDDDGHAVRFRTAGRWRARHIASLVCFNAFWNGAVGVFTFLLWGGGVMGQPLLPADMGGWRSLFWFLIPFQLIGLGMAVMLLAALAEGFRRTLWTFRQGAVERRSAWLGVGRTRRHDTDADVRLKVREHEPKSWIGFLGAGDEPFELALLRPDGTAAAAVPGLTLGEAGWMKAELEARRPGWFGGRTFTDFPR